MDPIQVNKIKTALKDVEKSLERASTKVKNSTQKLKKCKKNIIAHVSKLRQVKDALVKNKFSTNQMVLNGHISDMDEYTEHINAVFNSLIRDAENILKD